MRELQLRVTGGALVRASRHLPGPQKRGTRGPPAGQLITTVSIGGGSGGTDYRVHSGKVAENVRGVHNLCLVARGEDAPADGYLFSVTWFNFTKNP